MAWMDNPHDTFMASGKKLQYVHTGPYGRIEPVITQPVCGPPLFTSMPVPVNAYRVGGASYGGATISVRYIPNSAIHRSGYVETNFHKW